LCKHLSRTLLYILVLGTYDNLKFAREKLPRARRLLPADMHDRWLQVCRVKITFRLLPTNCFVSATINLVKCLVNWIPLRIRVRSKNNETQPHLEVGFGGFFCHVSVKRDLRAYENVTEGSIGCTYLSRHYGAFLRVQSKPQVRSIM